MSRETILGNIRRSLKRQQSPDDAGLVVLAVDRAGGRELLSPGAAAASGSMLGSSSAGATGSTTTSFQSGIGGLNGLASATGTVRPVSPATALLAAGSTFSAQGFLAATNSSGLNGAVSTVAGSGQMVLGSGQATVLSGSSSAGATGSTTTSFQSGLAAVNAVAACTGATQPVSLLTGRLQAGSTCAAQGSTPAG